MKVTLCPTGCSSRWTLNEGHDLERHGSWGEREGGEASHINQEEYGEGNHGDGKVIAEAI